MAKAWTGGARARRGHERGVQIVARAIKGVQIVAKVIQSVKITSKPCSLQLYIKVVFIYRTNVIIKFFCILCANFNRIVTPNGSLIHNGVKGGCALRAFVVTLQ